jgi:hypothetical protein
MLASNMEYVRTVTLEEVQNAQRKGELELDEGTKDVGIRHRHNWHEWEFDREDIGSIIDSTPPTSVFVLYPLRVLEMHSARAGSIADLASHVHFLKQFQTGNPVPRPVLLREAVERQIHDGGHRIYAAYEFASRHPGFRLRVYWNRAKVL